MSQKTTTVSEPSAPTSLQRLLTTLSHREPDRVPLFLLLSLHGAKEVGLPLEQYFSKAEHVAEGQIRIRARYDTDCLSGLFYAAVEVEAWGGEVIFYDDGPPNSGEPLVRRPEAIDELEPPRVADALCLTKVLSAIAAMKARVGDTVPIIGVAISPFSLPVMQLGFEPYLRLIYEQPVRLERLLRLNERFCVDWANAQLAAGATAICYFDPVSSPMIIPRELYLKTGFEVAMRTLPQIKGPTATHLASGRVLPIVDDIAKTGTAVVSASAIEDLSQVKEVCRNRLTVIGHLNGIEMTRWTPAEAESRVKTAIAQAGPGGGFLLSDNHGEIPWPVTDEILQAISEARFKWGRYPLTWIADEGLARSAGAAGHSGGGAATE